MSYVIYKRSGSYEIMTTEEWSEWDYPAYGEYVKVQEWEPPVEPRQILYISGSGQLHASMGRFTSLVCEDLANSRVLGFLNPETGELEHD